MTNLTIRIKRGTDGDVTLTCVRANGTSTWQRQTGPSARFFPLHDLTHLAVETVLGELCGFYGLVAAGWEITDFGHPWPRGPLPQTAADMELVIGFLDAERASGEAWTAAMMHERSRLQHDARGAAPATDAHSICITDAQLGAIRQRRAELFAEWERTPPGDTLTVVFHV